MTKSNFRDWTLDKIDDILGLTQTDESLALSSWLNFEYEASAFEQQYILLLQKGIILGANGWNEVELENKFISPLIVLAEFDNRNFSYFLERDLSLTIGEYELTGRVDGMIASGFRNPKKPFFCLNEYKKQTDPDGDPIAQCLIAMLAAQYINNNNQPVYGCFIIGKTWGFIVLCDKNYTISKFFNADDEEIFDIYRILKGLKNIIQSQINSL